MNTLYNATFGHNKSRDYWLQKHDINPQFFTKINWKACGTAMKSILFGKNGGYVSTSQASVPSVVL
jgi:hypothetical protein